MEPAEIINVDKSTVACDGGKGGLGHPRVFLNMEGKGQIDCPYCGRRFVLNQETAAE
ncbi:MAG: zinc-finger domain-containing protein [Kiloniellaceae bacterium]